MMDLLAALLVGLAAQVISVAVQRFVLHKETD